MLNKTAICEGLFHLEFMLDNTSDHNMLSIQFDTTNVKLLHQVLLKTSCPRLVLCVAVCGSASQP